MSKHALIAEFKRQVEVKPDISEIQGTLTALLDYYPSLMKNTAYKAIMVSAWIYDSLSQNYPFADFSHLIYEFEKLVDLRLHYQELIDYLETEA